MAKKIQQVTGDVSEVIAALEARLSKLEKQVQQLASPKTKTRKVREYTEEQRKAIRDRILAGQEAAREKRESEGNDIKEV